MAFQLSLENIYYQEVGNISDFLVDGKNAFIAEPGNIISISNKMIEVSDNPNNANTIAIAGKETALNEFNSIKETKKILSIMFK